MRYTAKLMDNNKGLKRCCIRLGCRLRSDTLKNPYINPDQLTTLYTARLLITLTIATTLILTILFISSIIIILNSFISTIFLLY